MKTWLRGRLGPVLLLLTLLGLAAAQYARTVVRPGDPGAMGGGGGSDGTSALVPGHPPLQPVEGFERRVSALRDRIEGAPRDTTALRLLGQLLQDGHRPQEAALQFERLLEVVPGNRDAWLLLANAYGAGEDWSTAAEASHRMLVRFPDDPSAMFNLGAALANQGHFSEASAWWDRVAESHDAAMVARARSALVRLDSLRPGR